MGLIVNFWDKYLKPKEFLIVIWDQIKKISQIWIKICSFASVKGFYDSGTFGKHVAFCDYNRHCFRCFCAINAHPARNCCVKCAAVSNAQLTIEQVAREMRTGANFSFAAENLIL